MKAEKKIKLKNEPQGSLRKRMFQRNTLKEARVVGEWRI
jgi:hypothetical protein